MTLRKPSPLRWHITLLAALVLIVPLLAACADDEDDPTATSEEVVATIEPTTGSDDATTPETEPTTADGTGTPDADSTADTGTTTPDTTGTPDGTGTPDADGTPDGTGTPDADGTPDGTGTPDADSTPDGTGTPDADMTPDTTGTPDTGSTPETTGTPDDSTGQGMFGDVTQIADEVDNFTLDLTTNVSNLPDGMGVVNSADATVALAQSEPQVYHLMMDASGDQPFQLEIWSLPDAVYIAEDGDDPIQLPPEMATLYTPGEVLMMVVPPVELLQTADEAGQEEIDGRTATRYDVDAETAMAMLMAQGQMSGVTNPQGEMQIWVDEELDVVIQMMVDITFENEDGTEGSIMIDLQVTDIDETTDIESPSAS